MSGIASSWLVGAFELEAAATIVVDGINNAVIPAGVYYLYDATGSLSLIDVILTAVTPFMTTPAIFVALDRKLRVTAGASFTWAIPVALQDVLGFGASIPSTSSATATDVSTLLWSPGWPETTVGHPTGTSGWEQPTRSQTSSPSGQTIRTTIKGASAVHSGLAWNFVLRARAWAIDEDDGLPGDFRRFWVDVLKPGRRLKLYRQVPEDSTSSVSVSWPAALGPYKARELSEEWWRRSIKAVDSFSDVRIDVTLTSELT